MSKLNRTTTKLISRVLTLIIFTVVLGCESLPESSFELANDSRLPIWFSLPPGMRRADVSVKMTYYNKAAGRSATFTLHDKTNHLLGTIAGTLRGLTPVSVKDSSASFEVITAQGVTEVIEHKKMEPLFYLVDDPAIVREVLDAHSHLISPVRSSK